MRALTDAAESLLRSLLASAPKGASSTTERYPPDESRLPEAERAFEVLDPDMPYPDWVRAGMALKAGVGDAGLPLWVEWSALGAKFKPGEPEEKWASFHRDEVGLGTLFEMAREAGDFRPGPTAVEQFQVAREERAGPFRPVAEFEERRVEWLWRPFMPFGHLTVVAGSPGEGKSTVLLDIAARISTGRPLPGSARPSPAGEVLIVNAEDDPEDTLKGRLRAMGADQSKVWLFDFRIDGATLPMLPDGVDAVEDWLKEHPKARLVVFDPLDSFVPMRLDTHKSRDIRQCLDALTALSTRYAVTFAVVTHISKSTDRTPLNRVLGSVGVGAAARSVIAVGEHRDTGLRAVAQVKTNLVGRDEPSFTFEILPLDPLDSDSPVRVQWGEESWLTADELWEPPQRRGLRPERTEADAWLDSRLPAGAEAEAGQLQGEAEVDGINVRTLRRAADRLGVQKAKTGGTGAPWVWRRPA